MPFAKRHERTVTKTRKGRCFKRAELVRVAVDAMGGDNAPTEIIKGVVEAVHADERV